MFCPKCGNQNDDNALFCANCGERLRPASEPTPAQNPAPTPTPNPRPNPKPPIQNDSVGALGILMFCLPIVGIILFFVWQNDYPKKSKQACYLALGGFGTILLFYFIIGFLGALMSY